MTSWPSWNPWGGKTNSVDAVTPGGSGQGGGDFVVAAGSQNYLFERDAFNPQLYQVYTLPNRSLCGACPVASVSNKAILSEAVDGARSPDRIPSWVPQPLATALFQRLFQQQRPGQ